MWTLTWTWAAAAVPNAVVLGIATGHDPACPPEFADERWTVSLEATGPGAPVPVGERWCWAAHSPSMMVWGAKAGEAVLCLPRAETRIVRCVTLKPVDEPEVVRRCWVPFLEDLLGICPLGIRPLGIRPGRDR
jgi:hypothetical protein